MPPVMVARSLQFSVARSGNACWAGPLTPCSFPVRYLQRPALLSVPIICSVVLYIADNPAYGIQLNMIHSCEPMKKSGRISQHAVLASVQMTQIGLR
jgi:hypothetical protein